MQKKALIKFPDGESFGSSKSCFLRTWDYKVHLLMRSPLSNIPIYFN